MFVEGFTHAEDGTLILFSRNERKAARARENQALLCSQMHGRLARVSDRRGMFRTSAVRDLRSGRRKHAR